MTGGTSLHLRCRTQPLFWVLPLLPTFLGPHQEQKKKGDDQNSRKLLDTGSQPLHQGPWCHHDWQFLVRHNHSSKTFPVWGKFWLRLLWIFWKSESSISWWLFTAASLHVLTAQSNSLTLNWESFYWIWCGEVTSNATLALLADIYCQRWKLHQAFTSFHSKHKYKYRYKYKSFHSKTQIQIQI